LRGSPRTVVGFRRCPMCSPGRKAVTDSRCKCAVSMRKVPTRKQEEEDWDFEDSTA
jgi:hypothetical protein